MIRATAGTWVSYATSLVFQILFAARFGTSAEASGFIIIFTVAVSVAGIFITTATVLILPRLVERDGQLSSKAMRRLGLAAVGVGVGAAAVACASVVAHEAVARSLGLGTADSQAVLVLSAAIVGLFGFSGLLGAVALARGRRFVPPASSALPSTLGALYLATAESASVPGLFVALAAGALIQLVFVGMAAWLPRPHLVSGTDFDVGKQAALTAAVLIAISLLVPIQRFAAGALDVAGVARFDYAARSLQAAQQLLIGGLLVAVLPDWAKVASDPMRLKVAVSQTVRAVAAMLMVAGLAALVAAPQLVALVFERGAFTPEDSAAVALLVRVMSVGFVAEGISLVLVQAAFASHRAPMAIRAGFVRVGLQVPLTLMLGAVAGALGVAIAYSLALVVVAALLVADWWGTMAAKDPPRAFPSSRGGDV